MPKASPLCLDSQVKSQANCDFLRYVSVRDFVLYFISEVLVGFTMSTYQVAEGMSLQVCVVLLNGTIGTGVDIDLQYTLNQTGKIKSSDFYCL